MAQHDYNIANQTGANFRTDLNNALLAISSNNSGSSEPSTIYAYEWWIDTSANVLKLRNSSNNAWITMPFSITADNTVDINAGTVNGITSLSFSSGATVTSILDEDNFSSDSATALATQQSIKAYIASQITLEDLDITDGSSSISIDLDSETLSLLGGTGVTSTASGNGVTFAIGQSVGTSDNVVFNQVTGALVGNASTATALATARNISGVSFDGTANITLDTDDIGEGTTNKYFTNERVDDQVNTLLTAGANISLTYDDAAGTLTIANTNTADITSVVAGDGLTGGGTSGDVTLAVGVDDSSIEINSDALRVKATGITNAMLAGSIANAKLANSSITVNSQAIALGGSHTFDTDDIGEGTSNLYFTNERTDDRVAALIQNGTGISFTYNDSAGTLTPVITLSPFDTDNLSEGSSNLYYTDTRANSAIDARVTNTFINNLSGVVADTATALATGRTIGLSGDVTATGVSFDGTGNITLSTTIAADSVALGTDTTGNYVSTIAGTTNEVEVSGSGSETATVTIGLPDDVTISGNLTVNGTTTTVNSDTLSVTDPLIKLAKANSGADSLDIGFYGLYDTSGSQDLFAGLFRDANDSGKFKLFKDLQVEPTTTVNTSGTGYAVGTLVSNLEGNVTGNVTGQVSTLSNHDTDNLSEGSSNLYFTNARSRSAISASGDISYNSSTGVISFTQATAPVTSVNSATGAVILDTDDIAEGSSNLYMTTERVQDIVGGMVTGNTETGITVTYDDSDGTLDFVVGTLNQDTTGNAATATALETARNIGGVSFDGTGNIDLAGVNTSGNQDTSGNAATATALATGRNFSITGDITASAVSFDGTGNVALSAGIDANTVGISELNVSDGSNGQVLTTDGAGNLSFSTVSGTTINNNADNRVITGSGSANTLEGESGLTYDGSTLSVTNTVSATTLTGTLSTAAQTNITSVGTLTALTVSGDLTVDTSTLKVDSSNNRVGIGTASPQRPFHLDIGTNNTAARFESSDAEVGFEFIDSAGTSQLRASGDYIILGAGESETVRITSASALGIKKTPPSGTHVGWSQLFIGEKGSVISENANSGGLYGTWLTDNMYLKSSTGAFANITTDESSAYRQEAGVHQWFTQASGSADAAVTLSEKMRIDSSGNVGIGNTSPSFKLEVTGNVKLGSTGAIETATNALKASATGDNGFLLRSAVSSAANPSYSNVDDTNTGMFLPGSDVIGLTTGGTERMRIDASGNVGIGTTTVGAALVVNGASGDTLRLNNGSAAAAYKIGRNSTDGKLEFNGTQSGDIAYAFGGVDGERLRIDSSGNVGIGETSPSARIHVKNSDASFGFLAENSNSSYGTAVIAHTATSGTRFLVDFRAGSINPSDQVGTITTNGTSTAYNTSSDYRLKENVNYDWNATTRLKQLKPARFNFKADADTTLDGFIAHEVQDIVPEAISGEKDGEKMQGIDQSKLVPLLVKTIQELEARITALES